MDRSPNDNGSVSAAPHSQDAIMPQPSFAKDDKQFQELVENAMEGIYRSTEDGRYLFVNQRLADIFGYDSRESFLSHVTNASQIYVDPEDRRQIFRTMKKKGHVDGVEVQVIRRDGQTIWISLNGRAVPQPDGPPVYEGFVVDINRRKQAEAQLLVSEERFRILVEQAGDAFFVHDFEGRIIDVNRLACDSLGYSREELLQMAIPDIDIDAHRRDHKPQYWESIASGEHVEFEGMHLRKDGSTFPVEVRMSRLDLTDEPLLLSLARDVTVRKKDEERLKNAFTEIKKLKNKLEQENVYLRQEIETCFNFDEMVGESPAFKRVLNDAAKVAPEDTCVLILGETGAGKELLARAIHQMSRRNPHPMIKVNCAALPPSLIENELFGREKGAFTGADSKQIGRFEAADGSTLFLDEIGELPLEVQAKLLRVIQDGTFERLGSPKTMQVDTRLIAATNQDIFSLVGEKKFRSDLFYRLSVFPIKVPPLRERPEDIPLLALSFVQEYSRVMGKPVKQITRNTMTRMINYAWPGNIREMKNVIERAMILSPGPILHIDQLDKDEEPQSEVKTLGELERTHIIQTLEQTGWRVSGPRGAAQKLGLKESTLRWRMKKLGVERPGV